MKIPGKMAIMAQLTDQRRESVTRESFWENDFSSSIIDEMHFKPFDPTVDSAPSTVLLPLQSCSSTMLFGPKRPISFQIGSSNDPVAPVTTAAISID